MERMRISVFSILGNLEGLSFLDIFSGSGIMCAEAASRGAVEVCAVEKDFGKKRILASNLSFVEEKKNIFIMDAFAFLKKFKGERAYDVIYLDPPFAFAKKTELLNMAFENAFLKESSVMVIHYPKEDDKSFENVVSGLETIDIRAYGRSTVRFLRKRCLT